MSVVDGLLDDGSERSSGQFVGFGVGIVTDNTDPDALGRVRVRLPWYEEGSVSNWARIAVPMAGKDMGTFFLPDIGDEVLVGAEQGDPSHLYVIGMLWSGRLTPPETNADRKNSRRFIKTRAGHQLLFVDEEGASLAELALQDGKKISFSKEGVEITDGTNKIVIDTSGGSMTIQSAAELKIKSNKITIEAGASMELKSSGAMIVKGTLVQIN